MRVVDHDIVVVGRGYHESSQPVEESESGRIWPGKRTATSVHAGWVTHHFRGHHSHGP